MANFRVPYLVGNKIGRDHGIWPTILRSEAVALLGANTSTNRRLVEEAYPIAVNLATYMVMSWRVREWTIPAIDFTIRGHRYDSLSGGAGGCGIDNAVEFALSISTPEIKFECKRSQTDTPFIRNATDEKDILGPWGDKTLAKDYFDPPGPALPTPIWRTLRNLGFRGAANQEEITISEGLIETYNHDLFAPRTRENNEYFETFTIDFLKAGYVIYDPDTELFYPPTVLLYKDSLPTAGIDIFKLTFLPQVRTETPPVPDVPIGYLTLTFGATGVDEVNIPIGWQQQNADTCPLVGAQGSFDGEMRATKFWQNQNSAGQLVYDETDGHQLADPFL